MEEYSELWNDFAYKYNDKLERGCGGDWGKLNETEQEIAALWKLGADLFNEGFLEFFVNWGYDCYTYAMRGIERVGCIKLYKLLDKAYKKVFEKFQDDNSITSYEDILPQLTERDEEILDDVFEKFDEEYGEQLCEAAYKFYGCKAD